MSCSLHDARNALRRLPSASLSQHGRGAAVLLLPFGCTRCIANLKRVVSMVFSNHGIGVADGQPMKQVNAGLQNVTATRTRPCRQISFKVACCLHWWYSREFHVNTVSWWEDAVMQPHHHYCCYCTFVPHLIGCWWTKNQLCQPFAAVAFAPRSGFTLLASL